MTGLVDVSVSENHVRSLLHVLHNVILSHENFEKNLLKVHLCITFMDHKSMNASCV